MSRLERPQGNSYGMNVSKSFIPGRGYVPASQAGKQALRMARSSKYSGVHSGRGDIARRGPRAADSDANQELTALGVRDPVVNRSGRRNIYWDAASRKEDRDAVTPFLPKKGARRPVVINPSFSITDQQVPGATRGRFGSKSPAVIGLTRLGHDQATVSHELAHAASRRKYHRTANFTPAQLGREEARADVAGMRASGRKRSGNAYEFTATMGPAKNRVLGGNKIDSGAYRGLREKLGHPMPSRLAAVADQARGLRDVVRESAREARDPSIPPLGFGQTYSDAQRQKALNRSMRGSQIRSRTEVNRIRAGRPRQVQKALSESEAKQLAQQYGTRGPLPRGMSREEKMRAYEARYIASGGPKGEVWDRRARAAAGVTAAGAGVTGVGAIGALASRGPGKVRRAANAAMLGGTAAWGLGSAAGYDARRRRASYRSSPAGVAGSALTRMRNYTPGE